MRSVAPHCDDVAHPSCSKELAPIAEATQRALLQWKLSNLFQV